MSKPEEEKTLSLSEKDLERIIKAAVVAAIRESKEEDKLPINEVNELEAAPMTFSLLSIILWGLLVPVGIVSALFTVVIFSMMIQQGFQWLLLMMIIDLLGISVLSFCSARELFKTKKIEVLNTVFSAIMALASLIVAIIGTYFAYKAL